MIGEIIISILLYVLIPLTLVYWLGFKKSNNRFNWIVKAFTTVSYIAYIVLMGKWMTYTHYFKFGLIALLFIGLGISYVVNKKPSMITYEEGYGKWFLYRTIFFASILVLYNITLILSSSSIFGEHINLSFPFKEGIYSVSDYGRNSNEMWHAMSNVYSRTIVDGSQIYSVDIVKLNSLLMSQRGYAPKTLEEYKIFGETVYSPCNGTIAEVKNNIEDYLSYTGPNYNPEGNYIVIKSQDGVYVIMENLKKDSLKVKPGDIVKTGEPIAEVGSTAVSSYPHLHMYATRHPGFTAEGIKISFDNKAPLKNRIFIK